jgi:DNA-binding GntR family transcriptional regulator
VERRIAGSRADGVGSETVAGPAAGDGAGLLRRHTIAAQIHAVLRRDIICGRLAPRMSLAELELARRFGVSRTPIREAMIKLSEEGLVEIFPQYGSFVAPIKLSDVFDSQFAREALECAAVEKAIARIDERQGDELSAILERQRALERSGDDEAFVRADEDMHALIFRFAGHATAWQWLEGAKAQMDRVRYLAMSVLHKQSTVLAEHADIIEGLRARDRRGAVAAMRVHLRGILQTIETLRGQDNDYFAEADAGQGRLPPPARERLDTPTRKRVRKYVEAKVR